ncbi:hypothetical protein PSN45_004724 [Yamadazyma tenuis]|uniref:Uncharacterized protein n=1 Tax=Candida tenuis (strain ATCC 10573 / BCRC 21748 / CBS 615 / JCM 9827 / NBRC 10315 / NRRL Y-1498 / VKM Y-70) TaxID=590646 RepID=G3B6S3_CANTC|nr:uncharacterized protein CANTEDRAFT_114314 [Yamadazyma tenuis ATCC 10573]EGV63004.1 hypothetical protein CANTEDRAFT_114314 [Yamadazyma tenuis ATCC 10573]WEJ97176.1 hypothetical protein PSN45_004724 [Yamadazyma tenuis]
MESINDKTLTDTPIRRGEGEKEYGEMARSGQASGVKNEGSRSSGSRDTCDSEEEDISIKAFIKSPSRKERNADERRRRITKYNTTILKESREERRKRREERLSQFDDDELEMNEINSSDVGSVDSDSPRKKKRVSFVGVL